MSTAAPPSKTSIPDLHTQTLVLLDIPLSVVTPVSHRPDLSQVVLANGALAPPTSFRYNVPRGGGGGHEQHQHRNRNWKKHNRTRTRIPTAYAYINFPSKTHAAYFLHHSGGSLYLGGQKCRLVAKRPFDVSGGSASGIGCGLGSSTSSSSVGSPSESNHHNRKSWTCKNCQKVNFGFRNLCFGCNASRESVGVDLSDEDQMLLYDARGAQPPGSGTASASANGGEIVNSGPVLRSVGPTRELIIRNLASRTKEGTLKRIFGLIADDDTPHADGSQPKAQSNVVSVKLIRDHETRQSKRYAFIRFASVEVAKKVLRSVCTNGMIVDEASVIAGFAEELDTGSEMKTYFPPSYVARKRREELERLKREKKRERQKKLQGFGSGAGISSLQPSSDNPAVIAAKKAEALQASGFSFDVESGYYRNPKSCRYYDPKTSLYFLPEKGGWCSKDPSTGEFVVDAAVDEEDESTPRGAEGDDSTSPAAAQAHVETSAQLSGDVSSVFGSVSFGSGTGCGTPSIDVFGIKRSVVQSPPPAASRPQPNRLPGPARRPPSLQPSGPAVGSEFVPNLKFEQTFARFETDRAASELKTLQKRAARLDARRLRGQQLTGSQQQGQGQERIQGGQKRKHAEAFPNQNLKDNIGKKMLKKMGWVEGTEVQGSDPDSVRVREGRTGIGFGPRGRPVGRGGGASRQTQFRQRMYDKKFRELSRGSH